MKDDLTPTQKATLRFLQHRKVTTVSEYVEQANLKYATARARLQTCVRLGLAQRVPSNDVSRNGRPGFYWYEIKETL